MRFKTLLLPIILGLFASCGGEQPGEEKGHQAAVSESEGPQDLVGLLPEPNAVAGWSRDGEPRFFAADNLWEFINGAAEGYLLYGFEEVVTSDYSQESSGQQAVIDIYRMQDPVRAFGIYCQERNPDYEFLDIGGGGYVGGTALNFWRGPYYVKITVFEESDELRVELSKLAAHISGKIDHPATEPAEVAYFPTENQKPHSVQYLPRDVLGQSYLSNAYEAQYQDGDREYKIVAVLAESSDSAKEGLAKYRQFIAGANPEIRDLEGVGDEGFTGTDSFYGKVVAIRSGNKILVELGAASVDSGKNTLAEMLEKFEPTS
jgi:hypothetical protein